MSKNIIPSKQSFPIDQASAFSFFAEKYGILFNDMQEIELVMNYDRDSTKYYFPFRLTYTN